MTLSDGMGYLLDLAPDASWAAGACPLPNRMRAPALAAPETPVNRVARIQKPIEIGNVSLKWDTCQTQFPTP